ncbi:alpha-glycosidase [Firmicutes bacterium TM09-10]|jgi:cyclomaltodextrinase|nr:alpha-glycosidase [Lachnospiraceae bacterium]RHU31917.1 alpha-glycosidase [Firmicutes bacterium TM09-10]
MEYSAIFHDMDKRFCYAIEKDLFVIRVQVKKDDMKEIILHYEDKYIPMEREDTRKTIVMKKVATSQFHDYYEAQVRMHLICLRYFFEFTDMQGERVYYGNYEFDKEYITNRDRMFDCPQNLREEEMFEVPDWAANKVVYQIFPSRFAASQPVDKKLWYKAPITPMDDLHGDFRGIIDHLDHIQDLGIDVIYMTPSFKSNSCHKYDTIDYYEIDPSFGTKEELKELVQKAHDRGMKVVMDAVFNHTGKEFFAFKDILEKGEKSKYLDWYYIDELPLKGKWGEIPNFLCFGYYGGMPKLNLKNPEVEKYITDVACYWIRECDIDGWRLDVGDEISHFFWKRFRRAIKAVKKDMLIIGEIWHYAGDFLEGDEWDTVMNYPFYLNLIDLLADEKISVSQFVQNLGYLKGRLHKKCYPLMWNLIDSHDTARFLHLCKDNKKKQHLAAAFQLLLPGMPMIYYGDEYAMPGANDPDCRRGMYWDEEYQDKEMFEWYKRLLQVRKAHTCIVEGELAEAITRDEDETIVLIRKNGEETIALIFNCSNHTKEFKEYAQKQELLTEKVFDGKVEALDAAVIVL